VHPLVQVVADELSDTEHRFFLHVEDAVIYEDVRMSVQSKDILQSIALVLELIKPVIFDL